MPRIDKLSSEHVASLPTFAEKWTKIGLSTEPIDDARCQAAISDAYRCADIEPPKIWIRLKSPVEGAVGAAYLKALIEQLPDTVRDTVRDTVWDTVGDTVWDTVRATVGATVGAAGYGQHDAHWLGYYDTFLSMGVPIDKVKGLISVATESGWWWPFAGACIYTDRPSHLYRDTSGRLHAPDRKAIEYPDGWGVYCWHGVRVPEWVIMDPARITPEMIEAEQNTELRRILIERFGMARYLERVGAVEVDRCQDCPSLVDGRSLFDRLVTTGHFDDDNGRPAKFMIYTCPSTDRVYASRVPPEMRTAAEAMAWKAGVDVSEWPPVQAT